jgi:PPOX class probable F420-dependent enzyme
VTADLRRLATSALSARLATIDPDGAPNLVPIVFAIDGDVLYSAVDDKPKTTMRLRRLANVRRDPRVTVLVDHYEDDWSALWWVRLRGQGRVLDAGDERERALDLLAERYEPYRRRRPSGPVIAVDVTEWTGWHASPGRGPT